MSMIWTNEIRCGVIGSGQWGLRATHRNLSFCTLHANSKRHQERGEKRTSVQKVIHRRL
jgi:hypothetical protein